VFQEFKMSLTSLFLVELLEEWGKVEGRDIEGPSVRALLFSIYGEIATCVRAELVFFTPKAWTLTVCSSVIWVLVRSRVATVLYGEFISMAPLPFKNTCNRR